MKIYFFDTKNIPITKDEVVGHLKDLPNFNEEEIKFIEEPLSESNASQFSDAEIVSVFVTSSVTKNVIDSMANLKMINARSTGTDHIDVSYAESKGVKTEIVKGYGAITVAEFTFALILALSRKVDEAFRVLKETNDPVGSLARFAGFDLHGKTIAVIGTGAIGRGVISIAKGFGMNVVAFDLFPNHDFAKEMNFEYTGMEEAISKGDIVTIHIPATKESEHLINYEIFKKMKHSAYLINTSRGNIVNTVDLVKALDEGLIKGVGFDVLEEEAHLKQGVKDPIVEKLLSHESVIVTPHIAFASDGAIKMINDLSLESIRGFSSNNQ